MTEGHDPYDDPNLKGMSRYFNSRTIKGRANVSMATLGLMFSGYVYMKFFKKKEAEN